MTVIDLSAWQENITEEDWNAIAEEFDGVILKLGENGELDEAFINHVNNAVAHGLPYGVYFYGNAEDEEDARGEAVWVGAKISEYLRGETPELGIWYDAESDILADNATAKCNAFIATLTKQGYTYVGVYSSWNWLSAEGAQVIDVDSLPENCPIWVANYSDTNYLAQERPDLNIKAWQYTDQYSDDLPYDANKYYSYGQY